MGSRNIDVFGILESKFDEKALKNLLRTSFQGMQAIHNFLFSPKERICVLGNPNKVKLCVVSMGEQSIHVRIECCASNIVFFASFIYDLNIIVQRRSLWIDLKAFGDCCDQPWILLGDFNNVLSQEKKKGGLNVKNYEIIDFVDCVAHLDLLELRFVGCFYTWMSPKVCSKLDRVLVNPSWVSSNYHASSEFITPRCISDHSLSIVSFLENRTKKDLPFKFFNMWALYEDFLEVVESNWRLWGMGQLNSA